MSNWWKQILISGAALIKNLVLPALREKVEETDSKWDDLAVDAIECFAPALNDGTVDNHEIINGFVELAEKFANMLIEESEKTDSIYDDAAAKSLLAAIQEFSDSMEG